MREPFEIAERAEKLVGAYEHPAADIVRGHASVLHAVGALAVDQTLAIARGLEQLVEAGVLSWEDARDYLDWVYEQRSYR